ncbi:hypothetical protein BV20DRAFT_732606 [Pilatotrama ljubarskyi]|nr:hypothetical protein BV20DRAFT_732606 [Pilatotrama ljubarskyi]
MRTGMASKYSNTAETHVIAQLDPNRAVRTDLSAPAESAKLTVGHPSNNSPSPGCAAAKRSLNTGEALARMPLYTRNATGFVVSVPAARRTIVPSSNHNSLSRANPLPSSSWSASASMFDGPSSGGWLSTSDSDDMPAR